MSLGVEVRTRLARAAKGIPVDTGQWFVAGKSATAPTDGYAKCQSLADVRAAFGARVAGNAALYDGLDTFFNEGGKVAYVANFTTDIQEALDLFDPQWGPGQVSAMGDGTDVEHTKLLAHAAANNRYAICDCPLTAADVGDLQAAGGTFQGLANADYGALFGPAVAVPPPSGITGVSGRTVQTSAAVAALCARVDGLGNVNRAAAGRDFLYQYVTDFTVAIPGNDLEDTLDGGVNPSTTRWGVLQNYGFQSGVSDNTNPYWQANIGRARMFLVAQATAIGENFMFKPIDGKGKLAGALKGALEGMLLSFYNADGLYGETPAEAFDVEVGASVNTDTTIAQGELHAVCEVRFTEHARAVIIDLVTVPITQQVA